MKHRKRNEEKKTRDSGRQKRVRWKRSLVFSEKPTRQRKGTRAGVLALCSVLPL